MMKTCAIRQRDLVAGGIDHVAVLVVSPEQSPDIAYVVGQAGDHDMGVVLDGHVGMQRAPAQDVVAGQRHQHGMFDIVVECVAVADAFESNARDRGYHFDQVRPATSRTGAACSWR